MRVGERKWSAAAVLAVVGSGVLACSPAPAAEEIEPAAEQAVAAAPAPAPELSDAEIAAIVVAANSIDVQYGEIAQERASAEGVKQFAATMITDHMAVNESAGALVTRLGVTPEPNDVSQSLETAAEAKRAELRGLSGAAFDRAYIDNEVAYHTAVLNALDDLLIPNAENAELRETLVSVRPAFEAHLQHAQSLQSELGGS